MLFMPTTTLLSASTSRRVGDPLQLPDDVGQLALEPGVALHLAGGVLVRDGVEPVRVAGVGSEAAAARRSPSQLSAGFAAP
jgi:hypothetical protein